MVNNLVGDGDIQKSYKIHIAKIASDKPSYYWGIDMKKKCRKIYIVSIVINYAFLRGRPMSKSVLDKGTKNLMPHIIEKQVEI